MNYAELVTAIEDITENTFTDAQVKLFVQQAEEAIYNATDLPVQRTTTSISTSAGNQFISLPAGYLYSFSVNITKDNEQTFLLTKDDSFLLEAYPSTLTANRGLPKYYSQTGEDILRLAPIPDAVYQVSVIYAAYPTSIAGDDKTATTTSYLGNNYESVLLNASLVEAARFMKSDPDIVGNYQQMYAMSLQVLRDVNKQRLNTDYYRSGGFLE